MEIIPLSQEEKASELKISYRTLCRWIKAGKIDYIRLPNKVRKWFLPRDYERFGKS